MKKLLVIMIAMGLLVSVSFGFSLRMDSMGRLNIALKDFETDVERNPANLVGLEENYFRLTLGMEAAGLTFTNEWDDIQSGQNYATTENEFTYSSMPISVLGFYKMGVLALGLQFDMPKETYSMDYKYDEGQHDTADYYTHETQKQELTGNISNINLNVGYDMNGIGLGLNFGQLKDTVKATMSSTFNEDRPWYLNPDIQSDEFEIEVTDDMTFYGLGVTYPTGNMTVELAYKMASQEGEGKMTKAVEDGIAADVNDHDNFPIIGVTVDSSFIHLKGCYKYNDNIDLSIGADIISHQGEGTFTTASFPQWVPADGTISQNNIMFGIGFHEDAFKLGLQLDYNMFTVEGAGYEPIDPAMNTAKSVDMTADAKLIALKAGAEYQATEKLILRVGAIKYAPLSATVEQKDYDTTTGLVTYTSNMTFDKLNEANLIISSVGVAYQFSSQMCLEYGYIGGKYLYNQNTMALITDLGLYGGALATQTGLFTPQSFTKHAFSIKYKF